MTPFVYEALPGRVIFGSGTLAQLAGAIEALGCRRALLLSTPGHRPALEALAGRLGPLAAGLFAGAVMHTPVEVTQDALAALEAAQADCLVALGGGSTIGLAKALALRTDLPQLAIPTTYAGSEATPVLGQTEAGRKTTLRSMKVLPEVILYDVDLTLSLPPALSAMSGLNAIAHGMEALYAQERNPITDAMAAQGIAALARALPRIIAHPGDAEARSDALFGAWACGVCLGTVGMSLHHKLCHTLGGSFGLAHAAVHSVILPHAAAYNADAAPEAMARIAAALGSETAPGGLHALGRGLGAPTSLREIGMPRDGLDRAAELATASPYWNPRPVTRDGVRALLDAAWEGRAPA